MFPKFTAPLKAAIRTSEGVLVFLTNVVLGVGAALEPSQLPPKEAAIIAGAVNIAHLVSRTTLKVFALQKSVGIEEPSTFDGLGELKHLVEQSHIATHEKIDRLGKYVEQALSRMDANTAAHIRAIADAIENAGHQPLQAEAPTSAAAQPAAQPAVPPAAQPTA